MKTAMPPKLWLSLAMTVLYAAALGCRMSGAVAHEVIGLFFCVLCILHMLINHRWFGNIPRGRYTFRRYSNTVLNMLLPIGMVLLCMSGILGSRHIFAFLGVKGGMDIRQLHTFAAYWGLVLLGMHAGLQGLKVLAGLRNIPGIAQLVAVSGVRRCLLVLLGAYGVWAFFDREMGAKLFLGFSFDFWDSTRPELLFYADTLAVLTLYAIVTHYTCRLFTKKVATPRKRAARETIRP